MGVIANIGASQNIDVDALTQAIANARNTANQAQTQANTVAQSLHDNVTTLNQALEAQAQQQQEQAATFQEQQAQLEENLQTLALRTERKEQFSDDLLHVMADADSSR